MRVSDDETTLIGGLFDKEETRSITVLPGWRDSGAGYTVGTHNNSVEGDGIYDLGYAASIAFSGAYRRTTFWRVVVIPRARFDWRGCSRAAASASRTDAHRKSPAHAAGESASDTNS